MHITQVSRGHSLSISFPFCHWVDIGDHTPQWPKADLEPMTDPHYESTVLSTEPTGTPHNRVMTAIPFSLKSIRG